MVTPELMMPPEESWQDDKEGDIQKGRKKDRKMNRKGRKRHKWGVFRNRDRRMDR